jgi:hypothetical protein
MDNDSSDEDDSDLKDCFRDEESFNRFTKLDETSKPIEENAAKGDDVDEALDDFKERNKIQLYRNLKKSKRFSFKFYFLNLRIEQV